MRSAMGGREGVAVRMNEAVIAREPCDRPLDRAMLARFIDAAGEDLVGHELLTLDVAGQVVSQPARKMKRRLRRDFRAVANERRRAMPADLDAPEQIGLRARHLEHARGIEARLSSENLGIGQKTPLGAAAVQRLADDRKPARRLTPREDLAIKRLAAGDLDLELLGQRIHDRNANAVEPAGSLVGAAVEFAAGMQH